MPKRWISVVFSDGMQCLLPPSRTLGVARGVKAISASVCSLRGGVRGKRNGKARMVPSQLPRELFTAHRPDSHLGHAPLSRSRGLTQRSATPRRQDTGDISPAPNTGTYGNSRYLILCSWQGRQGLVFLHTPHLNPSSIFQVMDFILLSFQLANSSLVMQTLPFVTGVAVWSFILIAKTT
jgi:hypothetical protein